MEIPSPALVPDLLSRAVVFSGVVFLPPLLYCLDGTRRRAHVRRPTVVHPAVLIGGSDGTRVFRYSSVRHLAPGRGSQSQHKIYRVLGRGGNRLLFFLSDYTPTTHPTHTTVPPGKGVRGPNTPEADRDGEGERTAQESPLGHGGGNDNTEDIATSADGVSSSSRKCNTSNSGSNSGSNVESGRGRGGRSFILRGPLDALATGAADLRAWRRRKAESEGFGGVGAAVVVNDVGSPPPCGLGLCRKTRGDGELDCSARQRCAFRGKRGQR